MRYTRLERRRLKTSTKDQTSKYMYLVLRRLDHYARQIDQRRRTICASASGISITPIQLALSKNFNITDANTLHCILNLPFQHSWTATLTE
jgi:hypothetical protein